MPAPANAVKAEENQFLLPAAYKAAHVLFPELP
jgi:hypothetical protein